MGKTVFDVLEEKLAAAQRASEESLTEGAAKSFDEYRHTCGVIRGLALATEILEDLVHRLEKSDD